MNMGQASWMVLGFIQRLLAFVSSKNHYLFMEAFCQVPERNSFNLCIYWDVTCKQNCDEMDCEISLMRFFQFLFGYNELLPIICVNDCEMKAIELKVNCKATLPDNFPFDLIPNCVTFYIATRQRVYFG